MSKISAVWTTCPTLQLQYQKDYEELKARLEPIALIQEFDNGRQRGFPLNGVMVCEPQRPI